jgi:hypothetical protein
MGGMCAAELTSVLEGGSFSARPQSACPVIAAFLRAYNDGVDDRRRDELVPYAVRLVGSLRTVAVERERAARCVVFGRRFRRPSRLPAAFALGGGGRDPAPHRQADV